MTKISNTDIEWEKFGMDNPYFGVVTFDKFLNKNLNQENKKEFFKTGEDHCNYIFDIIRKHFDSSFSPKRSLDYGCGVGRLTMPISDISEYTCGVDVSKSMLIEAQKNTKSADKKIEYLHVNDFDGITFDKFDFIHSYIVFQHIPVKRGTEIIAKLLDMLNEGGIGALHVTFHKTSKVSKIAHVIRHQIPLGRYLLNLIQGKPLSAPQMQMNSYNINTILRMLYLASAKSMHMEFTNHGNNLGVIILFKKDN